MVLEHWEMIKFSYVLKYDIQLWNQDSGTEG